MQKNRRDRRFFGDLVRVTGFEPAASCSKPMSKLSGDHPVLMIQSNETKSLEHSLWKAQLQIIFPMIESERIQMIERYRDIIEEAVKTECFDFNRCINRYMTQYGERLENAFDAEVGTLCRMSHLQCASDTSQYLFFLPDEEDRVRLALLHDMRNSVLLHP